MRFMMMQSSAKGFTALPSAFLSVAAHALLIGAAVHGTGTRARELSEKVAEDVFYLPPPDRSAASAPSAERIAYLEMGAGATVSPTGRPTATPMGKPREGKPRTGDDMGNDATTQADHPAGPNADSVYSILTVEESATRAQGSAAPAYPAELLSANVEGSVTARYIVDTTGHADPASIQIVRETHPGFAKSVREAIPGMRFTPGMVQGQPVRQVVEQSFEFRVTPAAPAEHTRTKPVP